MPSLKQLEEILPTLLRSTLHGPWSRAVGYHLLLRPPPGAPIDSPPQPLWPGGAPRTGARFTPRGGFGSIYLASDPITALKEVLAVIQHPHAPPFTIRTHPWTVFAVDGILTDVIDLRDSEIQAALGTNLQELTGDWAYLQEEFLTGLGPIPPTQILGQAAFNCRAVRGLQYAPAKNVGGASAVVVFADRLARPDPSYLEVYDPHEMLHDRHP